MKIQEYIKNGEKYYRFRIYLGKNPLTGEYKTTKRSGFKKRKDAEIAYLQLKHNMQVSDNVSYTFQEVYDLWIKHYERTVKSSTLLKTTELFRLHIIPIYGAMKIDRINLSHVQLTVDDWSDRFVKYASMKSYLSLIFKHAQRLGAIDNNPCDLIIMPKVARTKVRENFMDYVEALKFLELAEEHLTQKWYTFFWLLIYTGLRRGEAYALKWSDIDFSKGNLSVSKTLTRDITGPIILPPKTHSSIRIIDLDKDTLKIMRTWRTIQLFETKDIDKDGFIFPSCKNKPMPLPEAGKILARFCKSNNLKQVSLHGLRHTHCSILFESGSTLKEVQDRLGHSDIRTTMNIYAHVSKAKKKEVANRFANYMAQV